MESKMHTLEELHAHYKAVRARLNGPVKKVPIIVLAPKPSGVQIYPDPLDRPALPTTSETPARRILIEVAEKHNMPISAFRSESRKMRFVNLRHEACYRLSVELKFSLSQIGRLMGNRDHSTVMNAIKRHKKILVEGYKPKTRTKSGVSNACVTKVEPQTQNDHE
jgi:chromosomal replication initiator protein